jgi:hypothetical protein
VSRHGTVIVMLSFHYFLLYFTSHSYLDSKLSPSFYSVVRLIKIAKNVVITELLDNPSSVRPLHDKVRGVNKGRPTPPITNLITHHKSKTERLHLSV